MRVSVTGSVATDPVGGGAWDSLRHVQGVRPTRQPITLANWPIRGAPDDPFTTVMS